MYDHRRPYALTAISPQLNAALVIAGFALMLFAAAA
jgi:hypothetical protein